MSLKTFMHQLQFEPDMVKPHDWQADWEDAPLPYKLYRRLPSVELSAEIPLTLEEGGRLAQPDIRNLGHFLWYVYGLTQMSHTVTDPDSNDYEEPSLLRCRRFIPSGGGLYPSELYLYLKLEDLPSGIYHYDVAHHRLILLREGNFDSYLTHALGNRCEVPACFGVVFVSTMFWKNFFKYHNFSYRLQGLDAGVLIGQLLEVAKRWGAAASVYFQFLDKAVNQLLCLSQEEESVYAVIPLSARLDMNWFAYGQETASAASAAGLTRELTPNRHDHFVRSKKIVEFPMLLRMNEASLMEHASLFQQLGRKHEHVPKSDLDVLPRVNRLIYDMASICRKRYSPEADFVLRQVSRTQLAALLQEAMASFMYRNDLDAAEEEKDNALPRVSLYGCFYGVEGLRDGAYRYDASAHALQMMRPGDHRSWLQQGMSLDNVNLSQVPLCFHVAGDIDQLYSQLGYRGYRIQQMEAGMLVQRLLLAASASGMGGRPLLGFDASMSDDIYGMASYGQTSLIQIPIGPYRGCVRLEGSMGC
ncbi:SagB-type dehydrogenase family enzyme [Paenibacillus castaneae]|uniref:SagB family peptide dehydrogenase n=1 Tax=Paenibacillus castaneae TaxID=474957 RepID=UPI000C9AB96C|nr:SagB family peptide dehydrogenase [Paenibacillus castaneae]NIK75176.1 SagB-type dehydrogenase family enzyme [Paenibacillus castaneae]